MRAPCPSAEPPASLVHDVLLTIHGRLKLTCLIDVDDSFSSQWRRGQHVITDTDRHVILRGARRSQLTIMNAGQLPAAHATCVSVGLLRRGLL